MAFKIGSVNNTTATGPNTLAHHNLLDYIRRFVTGEGGHGATTQTGTGNGNLVNFRALHDAVAETWTIVCTVAAANGGTFSVTGSVSGAQAVAVVDVYYESSNKVAFKILDGSVDFIVGDQFQVTVTANADTVPNTQNFFGVGNGTMSGFFAYASGQSEVWTAKLITVVANGGVFSVTGSTSGAQANATVGTAYDNGKIRFTINDGSTDFVLNDTFTMIPQKWRVLRWEDGGGVQAANRELILQGNGYTGLEQIFIGFRTYHSVSLDYYNMSVAGFTGYVPGNSYITQPGYFESGIPTHNQQIDFWLVANGNRVMGALKVGTPVYETFYAGYFLPYATPSQYPYPLAVYGMLVGIPATRFSDTAYGWSIRGTNNAGKIRFVDGVWRQVALFPYNNVDTYLLMNDTMAVWSLDPLVLHDASPNIYGELEGLHAITGFNNVVENTTTIASVNYVVIQDVYRTGFSDYMALELR